jgi:threonine/homoserine/homoserine lactone efflux protein
MGSFASPTTIFQRAYSVGHGRDPSTVTCFGCGCSGLPAAFASFHGSRVLVATPPSQNLRMSCVDLTLSALF